MTRVFSRTWQDKAAGKRAEILSKIPQEWLIDDHVKREANDRRNLTGKFIEDLLSPSEREITALDSPEIVSSIREHRYSAEEVAKAFCKRAAIAQQLVCNDTTTVT
jgi:amidase